MKFVLGSMGYFNKDNQLLITQGLGMMENILNWPEWQGRVKSISNFVETIKNGESVLNQMVAADVKIDLKEMDSVSDTIGYTYLHGKFIWLNQYWLNRFRNPKLFSTIDGLSRVTGCLVHEVQHEEGFTHNSWGKRNESVPYKMQHVWEKAFCDFYTNGGTSGFIDESKKFKLEWQF